MTRWPRRRGPDPGLPAPLATFVEADWQTWLLDGPDPAQEGYAVPLAEWLGPPHPVEQVAGWINGQVRTRVIMVGIGDRPELVAVYRRHHAHKRWRAARRAWLEAHGHHDLAFDCWLDDVAGEHRQLVRELAELHERG